MSGKSLLNKLIDTPYNILTAYFPENQQCRLERYNGEWKIIDVIGK